MKNSGKTGKSTVIGSSAMVLNTVLNAVLIFGLFGFPAMGIQGAALATSLAMLLQLLWTLTEVWKKDSLKIRLSYLRQADRVICRDFNHYTLHIVGNYFFWGSGVTLFAIIIGHLGSDVVTANSIANIVRNLMACVSKGFGTAGAILVGNELGKNEIETVKLFAKRSTILAAVIGTCSGAILLLLRPAVLSVVQLTPAAAGYLSGMLMICSYYMVAGSINNMVIGEIFCAGGNLSLDVSVTGSSSSCS